MTYNQKLQAVRLLLATIRDAEQLIASLKTQLVALSWGDAAIVESAVRALTHSPSCNAKFLLGNRDGGHWCNCNTLASPGGSR